MPTLSDLTRRLLSGAAALALLVVLLTPIWSTRMESPQYKGDETLQVDLWLGRVEGDLHEIQTLNQYVGVTLPLDAPELRIAPWWGGALVVLAIVGTLVGAAQRRRVLLVTFAVMVVGSLAGVGALQYRLYEMGHDRADSVFARVEDFTPPIYGSKKIANFTVMTRVRPGGWALVAAFLLLGLASLPREAGATTVPGDSSNEHAPRVAPSTVDG